MNVLILGGPRQGEWLDLADDAVSWLDLLKAETYPIRRINWAVADMATANTRELFVLPIAVHPELLQQGPQFEQQAATNALTMIAMTMFMREHAIPQEIPPVPIERLIHLPGGAS